MSRAALWTATLLISGILTLGIAEVVLRLSGRTPWGYVNNDAREPTMRQPDARLGWKAKQGSFVVPAYDPSGADARFQFDARGRRRTRASEAASGSELVVVGGSYTQGWAISDEETFPWKLQERFPSLNVMNYGTAAYGSYQSLLVLENELPRLKSPAIVLYGFIEHHVIRNSAGFLWLKGLSRYSRPGIVSVPYATLNRDRQLVRHLPEAYLALPFRGSSATIALVEELYMTARTGGRRTQKRAVTERILLEMASVSRRFGSEFIVALLDYNRDAIKRWARFLTARRVRYADCGFPYAGMRVIGEGHPNGELNTRWADCIAEELLDLSAGVLDPPSAPSA